MTLSTRQIMEQSNKVAIEFLIADLTVALTFLDVAKTTRSTETRLRNYENARAAYETVVRLLPRVSPSDQERPALESRLAQLKGRLTDVGYDFGSERGNTSAP